MARTLVVSQPMFFPWLGLFEQARLADVFVHYDDVQLPQGGSFITRVQLGPPGGVRWLTVPIDRRRSGKLLNDVLMCAADTWRDVHLRKIRHAYAMRPFFDVMFGLVVEIYARPTDRLMEFNIG